MANNRTSIKAVLDAVCEDVKKAIQQLYISYDILPKSDLVKSVEVQNKRNVLTVFANDYVKFIESGRRKFVTKVPISAILKFINKRHIKPYKGISKNQLAFIIQNAIYLNGIKGKKGINKKVEKITLDMMFKSLDRYFKIKLVKGEIIVGDLKR